MAEIDNINWEKAGDSLTARFSASQVVGNVFTDEEQNRKFVQALCALSNDDSEVKVAGRRLRELLGCRVADFSGNIVTDAAFLSYDPHTSMRMYPLLDILEKYPDSRMEKPDLDFFVWGKTCDQIVETLKNNGFESKVYKATGDVWIIQVEGIDGIVTFIDGEKSWQTKTDAGWPKYGVKAKLNATTPDPQFELNTMYGSMYIYPLDIPNVDSIKDSLSPERIAVVGRVLLSSLTATDPEGHRLQIPGFNTQQLITKTVHDLYSFIEETRKNGDVENVMYRGGLRDFALAMRMILINGVEGLRYLNFSEDYIDFYMQVTSAWKIGKYEYLEKSAK